MATAAAAEGGARLAPASDPVPRLLEELVTDNVITCAVCGEEITRFEMFAVWPLAGLVVHMSHYGQRLEGRS
jgi:hypothetical protein